MAAGSEVTQTVSLEYQYGSVSAKVLTFAWTADDSDGSVPETAVSAANLLEIDGWFLYFAETDPGTTAPTDDYDIILNDANEFDIMGGALADRDETNTEGAYPITAAHPIDSTLTFVLTNNSVNSATGVLKLYFVADPANGTVTFNGASVSGDTAHDTADAGEPVKIGGKAHEQLSDQTAVVEGDRTNAAFDLDGALIIRPLAPLGDHWQETLEITDTSWTVLEAAPGASTYICVTRLTVINSAASVGTDVFIYNDDDGDIGDSTLISQGYASEAGGGWTEGNGSGVIFCTETANEALYAVCETTSSETKISIRGFKTKVVPQY